ncbi:hypothetical protein SUGI_1199620 [Cryptomeria japonica]|nr:hypothetical protein SUGI_1199620 [Cryptomeria japonica]
MQRRPGITCTIPDRCLKAKYGTETAPFMTPLNCDPFFSSKIEHCQWSRGQVLATLLCNQRLLDAFVASCFDEIGS